VITSGRAQRRNGWALQGEAGRKSKRLVAEGPSVRRRAFRLGPRLLIYLGVERPGTALVDVMKSRSRCRTFSPELQQWLSNTRPPVYAVM
jgi:hypothetical protein